MLRIRSLTYNEASECMGCAFRDEKQISTYILSFQIADQLLRQHRGTWKITESGIELYLDGMNNAVTIDIHSGIVKHGTVNAPFFNRYDAGHGVKGLVAELCSDLAVPAGSADHKPAYLFGLFVKLVEIFHARCDLRIVPGKASGEWTIVLGHDSLEGYIGEDGIAENRFGQKADIFQWQNLRPEKAAAYVFSFNRFCDNVQCSMK